MIFDEASTRRMPTPWGQEVQVRLKMRRMKQDALVRMLQEKGHTIDKKIFSNLVYGIGVTSDEGRAVIIDASQLLEIPIQLTGAGSSL